MSGIDAVIFDCDGVLFESRRANLAYYNKILDRFDYPSVGPEQKQLAHLCHTASSSQVLNELLEKVDLESAIEFAASLDYREFIPLMQPEPYLKRTLKALASKMPLAVATNRGASVISILEHFNLDSFFSAVVTSRDVVKPKPAPDMLLLAAEKLGMKVQNCLFVGDSELDQQAASMAKMPFAGYGDLLDTEQLMQNHLQLLDFLAGGDGADS